MHCRPPSQNFVCATHVADFIWFKLNFIKKTEKSVFEPPFWRFRGNVRTPFIAPWKARGRLSIRCNWTFFRYLLRSRRYKRKSIEVSVSREGGSFERKYQTEGATPTNRCWCQSSRVIGLSCGIKISAVRHSFVAIHACDRRTDTQTDGQIELRQQYRALHCMQSRGKSAEAYPTLGGLYGCVQKQRAEMFSNQYSPYSTRCDPMVGQKQHKMKMQKFPEVYACTFMGKCGCVRCPAVQTPLAILVIYLGCSCLESLFVNRYTWLFVIVTYNNTNEDK